MFRQKKVIVGLFVIAAFVLSACGGSSSPEVSKETIFDFYNKVDLAKTKTDVDAILGVAPTENSMMENAYDYMAGDSGYGVTVIYDSEGQAIAKTVAYNSNKELAPFCEKAVKESQVEQLTQGMTYEEAKTLLGGDGIEVNATELEFADNTIVKMYRWLNTDGSGIQIIFGADNTITNSMFIDKE